MNPNLRRIRRSRSNADAFSARATSFNVQRSDTSQQLGTEDDFILMTALQQVVIQTPYNVQNLMKLIERSNMLPQCIEAMVTNVAGYGWEIVPADPVTEMDEGEVTLLQSFIDSANSEESLTTVHKKNVKAKESVGFMFLEIIRDRVGRVSVLRHANPQFIRLMPRDDVAIPVTYDVVRGPRVSQVTEMRYFRRYVQSIAGKQVFFKEFGDPRRLDRKTGLFDTVQHPVPEGNDATELLHERFASADAYGVPRWINQLPSILGSREAEEVNYRYFEDNTVPPLMITVAGGRLTAQSYIELKRVLEREDLGKNRQNKIMLIEAIPERESLDERGTGVQLKVDKLADQRPSDALFTAYDEANQAKIRSSFRLPPVIVGLSQDVTFATANVSTFVAEIQVFQPERNSYDEFYNKKLVNSKHGLNLKTVMLRSRAPQITNPEMLVKALTALNVMGAVTPRSAIDAANRVMQANLPQYPAKGEEGYDEWMDKPIVFVTKGTESQAGQAVKDDATKQTEQDGETRRKPENGSE